MQKKRREVLVFRGHWLVDLIFRGFGGKLCINQAFLSPVSCVTDFPSFWPVRPCTSIMLCLLFSLAHLSRPIFMLPWASALWFSIPLPSHRICSSSHGRAI
ncbi:hypothetical protein VTN00DRAFT_188 [Thermoascus crustaceus]|uniref:uncharacterized protein n=1 Tax=Thermoascus crustaceus TaxID=5088 RepID=UPI0037440E52